ATQHFVLKGERLEQLTKLQTAGALLKLDAAAPNQKERSVTVELKSSQQPGTVLPVQAYVQDRSEPLTFTNALEITGPRPIIASSKLSLPTGMQIRVRTDEFPA